MRVTRLIELSQMNHRQRVAYLRKNPPRSGSLADAYQLGISGQMNLQYMKGTLSHSAYRAGVLNRAAPPESKPCPKCVELGMPADRSQGMVLEEDYVDAAGNDLDEPRRRYRCQDCNFEDDLL